MPHADYVIVGAGSAGCALAARLSEEPDVHVTVLEAGGPDAAEAIFIPPAWPTLWGTDVDWAYETIRRPGAPGRSTSGRAESAGRVEQPQRHGLHPRQPPGLGRVGLQGCTGWDYESLLPVMKRMEHVPTATRPTAASAARSSREPAANPNPISVAFVEAAREKGYPVTADFNGERFEGAGFHDLLIKDGRRRAPRSPTCIRQKSDRTSRSSPARTSPRCCSPVSAAPGSSTSRTAATHQLQVQREVIL